MTAPCATGQKSGVLTATLCTLVLLAVGTPLFIRMPLTNDAVFYDLQARVLLNGGTLYQDILEPNLPGVIWLHAAIRTLFGDSTEALRLFDLAVFAGIVALCVRWLRVSGSGSRAAAWFAAGATLYYLSISEWCHGQRHTWMLLPSLAALSVRAWRTRRLLAVDVEIRPGATVGWSAVEGILWGAAVWLKPHVALPGLAAWCVSQCLVRRRRYFLLDACGMLGGGLLVGALGVWWLIDAGSWPAFYETLTEWNPHYFRAGREHWTSGRFAAMSVRMWPWSVLHLAAIPIAVAGLWQMLPARGSGNATAARVAAPLLAAFYLGWCVHAFLLQHLFDYVHVPAQLIALLLVACWISSKSQVPATSKVWRTATYAFAALALIASPLLHSENYRLWTECVQGPNSPHLRDKLSHFQNPNREDLARIASFLKRSGVSNCDVCCYNSDLVSLYETLDLQPPTRFVYLQELLVFFPERQREIGEALGRAPHRFVVTDLVSCGLARPQAEEIGPDGPLAPPPAYRRLPQNQFPWSEPVVYRAGTYLVHRVDDTKDDVAASAVVR